MKIYIYSILILMLLSCIENPNSESQLQVTLRNIGHRLLLSSQDSTSRVLPINKIKENTYQITFEKQFAFVPDSLINLIYDKFKTDGYIVQALNCKNNEVVFAYEVSSKTDYEIPCIGRIYPTDCYVIQITFLKDNLLIFYLILASLILIIPIGFFIRKRLKLDKNKSEVIDNQGFIKIGQFRFYAEKGFLKFKNEIIELSDRETKLLKIFAENQNQIIDRERLMKEVWENEGIIVISRNLDVFVSKLRKKLQHDSNVKITNIHAKGYKLEVE
jgi:DNA-binding winged helix-turn-helix (wHTH) protein